METKYKKQKLRVNNEKIINALIALIRKVSVIAINGVYNDQLINWLEEQKKNTSDKLNEEYWRGYLEGKQCIEDKYKEQKPPEWSDGYSEDELQTRIAFYTYKDEDGILYLSNLFVEETSRNQGFGTKILKAAEKFAEAIGAISIRLKVKQDSPANAWYRKNGYGYMTFEDGYDWLEKTLEYLKPKQEWSKEDEWKRNELIKYLKSKKDYRSCWMSWLKSLHLKHNWKPSKEQMKAMLSKLPVVKGGGDKVQDILESLYNDLKKL